MISTEKWLARMGASGFSLRSVHFGSRVFIFEEVPPQGTEYRILYDKKRNGLSTELVRCGWQAAAQSRKWLIAENSGKQTAIYPRREEVIAKTRSLSTLTLVLMIILGSYLLVGLMMAVLIWMLVSSDHVPVEYVPSPYPILDLVPYLVGLAGIFIMAWVIFTFVKTKIGLKKLLDEYARALAAVSANAGVDCRNMQSPDKSRLIKVAKRGWYYDYDKLAQWLEQAAGEGMIVRGIKPNCMFLFEKAEPRKIKYFFDTQKNAAQDYYAKRFQSGFFLVADSKLRMGRLIIWGRNYTGDEPAPELFASREDRLACAKRLLLQSTRISILWVGLSILQIFTSVIGLQNPDHFERTLWLCLMSFWIVFAFIYSVGLLRAIRGYHKEKGRIMENGQ